MIGIFICIITVVFFLDFVDKNFVKNTDVESVTKDGAYKYMRELNNTASKKDRDNKRDADPERCNELKVKRIRRKRGQVTEGNSISIQFKAILPLHNNFP
jgi:hypothetical protein